MSEDEIRELLMFADLEGCELGEICKHLNYLLSERPYLSDEFARAIEKEMKDILKDFKENYDIVEQEINFTRKQSFLVEKD